MNPIGREMYEASMKRESQPVVVAVDPRDNKKISRLKNLINLMVVLEPEKRLKMKQILNELEKITKGQGHVCIHKPTV